MSEFMYFYIMKRLIKKEEGQKSGIYKITNLINGNYYIGCTKHFSSRFRSHLSSLSKNKSRSIILQNAINRHGIENFKFEIIKICDNYMEEEEKILQKEKPKYNCIFTNNGKRILSEKTRQRMSKGQKKRYIKNPPMKGFKRPDYKREVMSYVILEKDSITQKFTSVKEAANFLKVSVTSIYTTNYRKGKCKGYTVLILNNFDNNFYNTEEVINIILNFNKEKLNYTVNNIKKFLNT